MKNLRKRKDCCAKRNKDGVRREGCGVTHLNGREVLFSAVEAHGFGAAARHLETTPASASRRLKALEPRLRVGLVRRMTRKLSLTEAVEGYFREGRRRLHELDELEQALTAAAYEPEGDLTLAAKGSFCSNNDDVLAEAAVQGLGITLLPNFIGEGSLADGRLVKVLEDYQRAPLTRVALYPSRRHVPAKTRGILGYLIDHFAEPG
jgi:DNA-binding transcriptional LysR family regulator